MVNALERIGRKTDEAKLFERLLHLRNDVGLLPRNMTRRNSGWLGISLRPFRTLHLNAASNLQGHGRERRRSRLS